MLVECIGNPIMIDKVPSAEDIQVNFMANRQLRLKMKLVLDNERLPIDLFISSCSDLQISIPTISVSISGKDVINKRPISLNVSFNCMKRTWEIKGAVGNIRIDRILTKANVGDILTILAELVGVNKRKKGGHGYVQKRK